MATTESSSSSVPKWEPSSIQIHNPTLLRTDNYAIWRLEAQIHLDNADVWEVVSGVEAKPTAEDPHDNWKRKNRQARALLIQLVSDEYKGTIGNHASAPDAWKSLEDTLDRRNITSTMHLVNAILDMKKEDSTSWSSHIEGFESRWSIVNAKVSTASSTSKPPWLEGLKLCFNDQVFKAHLLLRTLPSSMNNFVDNRVRKLDLTYLDVRTSLLNLNQESSPSTTTSSAQSTSHHPQKKKGPPMKPKSTMQSGAPPSTECSYCRKRNLPSKGHRHTECNVLKKALRNKKHTPSSTSTSTSTSSSATLVTEDDISVGYAFHSSGTSEGTPTAA